MPYDSQPIFFLYPRPKYRKQLIKVVSQNYEDLRKLGEKTIEIAGAYAQISLFLNELQMVLNRNAQIYGYSYNGSPSNSYNPYNSYNPVNTNPNEIPIFGLSTVPKLNQMVEGLARSFNIQLPSCWGNTSNLSNYGNYLGNYNSYGGYNMNNNANMADFVNRTQCVAKNINLDDFDISIMKMWQQGGVYLAAELQRKYPQIAHWINIAAVAIDFIVKVFQKSPLRIVPTLIQSNDPQNGYGNTTTGVYGTYSPNQSKSNNPAQIKISLFAENQPNETNFVTAYPIVVHRWESEPDPEVISLNPPVLSAPCLFAGQNILKNTDLSQSWSEDNYTRDFKLILSSANGFCKEFPLKKNIGLGGWELNITAEELNQIPKVNMALESQIIGMRGFNEIKSPKFDLPLSVGGRWEISSESQKNFTVGGKRTVTLRNSLGSCRCLERVIYKPSFGGQFVFESSLDTNHPSALKFSGDGGEVSFKIDTTSFQSGQGTLEIKTYGDGQGMQMNQMNTNQLSLKLYPLPSNITNIKIARGDREALLTGERLEQLKAVKINGKRAVLFSGQETGVNSGSPNIYPTSNTRNSVPNSMPYQSPGLPRSSPNSARNNNSSNPNINDSSSASINSEIQPNLPPSQNPTRNQSSNMVSPNHVFQSQYLTANQNPNEKVVVFEDPNTRLNESNVTLELILEDERSYQISKQFPVALSRPAILSNNNEIEGTFLQNGFSIETNSPFEKTVVETTVENTNFDLLNSSSSFFPIEAREIILHLQNILTDYDFKVENIGIEARIENSQANLSISPRVSFEVLDWKTIKAVFLMDPSMQRLLGGRRLQFRIKDHIRGNSDWYSIKQTFARLPQIESVKCSSEMQGNCELRGLGIDYIAQISVDGGNNWFPSSPNKLQSRQEPDGKTSVSIPFLNDKKMLFIKLRDLPQGEGLVVSNFSFSNSTKKSQKK